MREVTTDRMAARAARTLRRYNGKPEKLTRARWRHKTLLQGLEMVRAGKAPGGRVKVTRKASGLQPRVLPTRDHRKRKHRLRDVRAARAAEARA